MGAGWPELRTISNTSDIRGRELVTRMLNAEDPETNSTLRNANPHGGNEIGTVKEPSSSLTGEADGPTRHKRLSS